MNLSITLRVHSKLDARLVVVLLSLCSTLSGQSLSLCRCWQELGNQCTQTGIRGTWFWITQGVLVCIIHQSSETQSQPLPLQGLSWRQRMLELELNATILGLQVSIACSVSGHSSTASEANLFEMETRTRPYLCQSCRIFWFDVVKIIQTNKTLCAISINLIV